MKKFSPAFDFFPERFWFAVEGWTDGEIVRYWRLLSQQWMRDGLPVDLPALQELARGKITDRVLEKFPVADDGKRRNRFLEKGRSDQMERMAASKFKNTRAAWLKHHKGESLPPHLETRKAFDAWVASGMPESSHRDATGMPQGEFRQGSGIPTTHHSPLTTSIDHTHTAPEGPGGVEFPTWFPATEEKAVAVCSSFPVPREYVIQVWKQLVSREFRDGAGQEVRRFPFHISARWPKERQKWESEQSKAHQAKSLPAPKTKGGF